MSIINRMLRELDKRNALRTEAEAPPLAARVRPVPGSRFQIGSEGFWRLLAALMAAVVLWLAWVMWQLMPRSVVHPTVLESAQARRPAAPPSRPPAAEAPAPEAVSIDMLKLATELGSSPPVPAPRGARPAADPPAVRAPEKPGAAPLPQASPPAESAGTAAAPRPPAAPAETRIRRSVPETDRERAERAYGRGLDLVVRDRRQEGAEALASSLSFDASNEAARQALVSLLVESGRYDEAARTLAEGLALRPSNVPFAMQLARVHVERRDIGGALSVLEAHSASGNRNAGYRAFRAALYQRVERHREAVEEYDVALKLTPGVGPWWIGRGISLQAIDRPKEALESFRRAKLAGNLSADLVAFADQRIRQLQ